MVWNHWWVSKFDGTNWTTYATANGLVSNKVYSIAIDGEGNKWFGTDAGVSKFDGINWTTYNTTNGLLCNEVHSIAIDSKGNKWFGVYGYGQYGGASKFNDTTWTSYKMANMVNTSIAINASDYIWFGTLGELRKFDGTNWTRYGIPGGPEYSAAGSLAIGNSGTFGLDLAEQTN